MTEELEQNTVTYDVKDNIAWVQFNRPNKRNAMNPKLNRQMLKVLKELEFRDDVGVLVLSGAGDSWSAGMDLKEYFRETEAGGLGAIRTSQEEANNCWHKLRWYQKPSIGMINGWCFGGAYAPLFACDIAIAADEAQLGLSEINWAILPGGGATKVAHELMPFRKAMYHAMTGEAIDGKTAEAWGLVTESVPLASLKERVTQVAEILLEKNTTALKATKDAMRNVGEMTFDNAYKYLYRAGEAAFYIDDEGRKQGIKQFIDDKTYKPGLGAYDKTKGSE